MYAVTSGVALAVVVTLTLPLRAGVHLYHTDAPPVAPEEGSPASNVANTLEPA